MDTLTAAEIIVDIFKIASYILPYIAMFLNSDMATKMEHFWYRYKNVYYQTVFFIKTSCFKLYLVF